MKGFIHEEALAEYTRLAAEKLGSDFSEGETYDFARCMRADGSFYGTSGKCRKGTETGDAPKKEEKQWSPPTSGKRPPENPTAEQITKMSTDDLWDGKATYKPGTAGHQAYKNEIDRRRERDERLKARGVEPAKPRKLKTDFRKEVERGEAKRKVADEKREQRRKLDGELYKGIQAKLASQKPIKLELNNLDRDVKIAARKLKKDPTPANRAEVKKLMKDLREKEREFNKGERELERMAKARLRIAKQNENERMTPEQRKEARRINAIIKEQG
jgi:hypothetical protein